MQVNRGPKPAFTCSLLVAAIRFLQAQCFAGKRPGSLSSTRRSPLTLFRLDNGWLARLVGQTLIAPIIGACGRLTRRLINPHLLRTMRTRPGLRLAKSTLRATGTRTPRARPTRTLTRTAITALASISAWRPIVIETRLAIFIEARLPIVIGTWLAIFIGTRLAIFIEAWLPIFIETRLTIFIETWRWTTITARRRAAITCRLPIILFLIRTLTRLAASAIYARRTTRMTGATRIATA